MAHPRPSHTIAIYNFHLKDHLGSNRVVASPDGDIEEINHYYPFGALMGRVFKIASKSRAFFAYSIYAFDH